MITQNSNFQVGQPNQIHDIYVTIWDGSNLLQNIFPVRIVGRKFILGKKKQ